MLTKLYGRVKNPPLHKGAVIYYGKNTDEFERGV